MEIGTDTDILLSSFNATDANYDTPWEGGTRAGFSFSTCMCTPCRAGGLLKWVGMEGQAEEP